MSIDLLKRDLLDRWLSAYDEMSSLQSYRERSVRTVYSDRSSYDLETYTKNSFVPKRPVRDMPSDGEHFSWGLDMEGRPCYYSGRSTWEGFYSYSDTVVEYIEFHLSSKMPVRIERIIYNGDKKVGYQSFSINGGMGRLDDISKTKKQRLDRILRHSSLLLCSIEWYHHEGDRIVSADCLSVFGDTETYTKNEYAYMATGELDEIVSVDADGQRRWIYANPITGISLQDLSEEVSRLMAEDVMDSLNEAGVETPVAMLEINYRSHDSYMPLLGVVSASGWNAYVAENGEEELFLYLMTGGDIELINLKANLSGRLFTALMAEVDKHEDYELAEKMIKKVAILLTQKKIDKGVKITKDFVAYAVDWSLCREDHSELLSECGMSESQVNDWIRRGII